MPAVSLIVPVYNLGAYVTACLDSIAAQGFEDFEVIVVDDGSTDDSRARALAVAEVDTRFRVVARANGGLSAARNTGLAEARADLIGFVDGDDRLHPDYLGSLHAAIIETGADWAACGIWLDRGGGGQTAHSGVHPRPDMPDLGGVTVEDISTWPLALNHFPSAWNKLYRKSLIEGLTFPEGLYYEDHLFFCRCAARTDRMARVARPLYYWRQEREGQITADHSDRIYEQFDILERLVPILLSGAKPGGQLGLGRLATRLCYERVAPLWPDKPRMWAFISRAQTFFAQHGLSADVAADPYLPRFWPFVLDGEPPVTVVLTVQDESELAAASLDALAAQSLWWFETLLVRSGTAAPTLPALPCLRHLTVPGADISDLRNAGLAEARGRYVVFLDAGDVLLPDALLWWVDSMLHANTRMGISNFTWIGVEDMIHDGVHDPRPFGHELRDGVLKITPDRAVCLHSHPSAKIFDRRFLRDARITFPGEPLGSWAVVMAAALQLSEIYYFTSKGVAIDDRPEARRLFRRPADFNTLLCAILEMERAPLPCALSRDAHLRLLLRACWEKCTYTGMDTAAKARFLWKAQRYCQSFPLPDRAARDPYIADAFCDKVFGKQKPGSGVVP